MTPSLLTCFSSVSYKTIRYKEKDVKDNPQVRDERKERRGQEDDEGKKD
jgi:hypothetical protein